MREQNLQHLVELRGAQRGHPCVAAAAGGHLLTHGVDHLTQRQQQHRAARVQSFDSTAEVVERRRALHLPLAVLVGERAFHVIEAAR